MSNSKTWTVLSIAGFVLTLLMFGLMAVGYAESTNWATHDEIHFFENTNTLTIYTWFLSAIMFLCVLPFFLFLVWNLISLFLHFLGLRRGDKYKYLNRKLSRITTIVFSVLGLVAIIALTVIPLIVDNDYSILGGFYVVLTFGVLLCIIQFVQTFYLRGMTGQENNRK